MLGMVTRLLVILLPLLWLTVTALILAACRAAAHADAAAKPKGAIGRARPGDRDDERTFEVRGLEASRLAP